jgi:ankyrin repeat protein
LVDLSVFDYGGVFGLFYSKLPIFLRQKLCQQLEKSIQSSQPVPQRIIDAYSYLQGVDPELPTLQRLGPFSGLQWRLERILEETEKFGSVFKEYPEPILYVTRLGVNIDKDEFDFGLLDMISDATDDTVLRLLQQRTTNGFNCFHAAVYGDHDSLISTFVKFGGNVNEPNERGWTPLHEACLLGRIGCAKELLGFGASINAVVSTEVSELNPLSICVWASQLEMLEFLLSQNADPWTPDDSQNRDTVAHLAAQFSPDALRILLKKDHRLALSRNTRLHTPLHCAAGSGVSNAIRVLVHSGADVNAVDIDGQTPLHLAWMAIHMDSDEVKSEEKLRARALLIEIGADQEAKDRFGFTPIRGGFAAALFRFSTATYFVRSPASRLGSGLYTWEHAKTNCPPAWHLQRYLCF